MIQNEMDEAIDVKAVELASDAQRLLEMLPEPLPFCMIDRAQLLLKLNELHKQVEALCGKIEAALATKGIKVAS